MTKPNPHLGLRHIALYIRKFDECKHFYVDLLGLQIVWQPDPDNLYLSSGADNVALHRAPENFTPAEHQHLDHLGFFLKTKMDVNDWHDYLTAHGCTIKHPVRDHRDGTKSFYVFDPDGNTVQMIYYPLD